MSCGGCGCCPKCGCRATCTCNRNIWSFECHGDFSDATSMSFIVADENDGHCCGSQGPSQSSFSLAVENGAGKCVNCGGRAPGRTPRCNNGKCGAHCGCSSGTCVKTSELRCRVPRE